jgi:hypothetical protein
MSTETTAATPAQLQAFASYRGFILLHVGSTKWGLTPSAALDLAADLTRAIAELRVVDDTAAQVALSAEQANA